MSGKEDEDYWLRNCQGFRVYTDTKRIGVVQDVVIDPTSMAPASLLVRTGILRLGVRIIPVAAIRHFDAKAMRLVVQAAD